MTNGADLAGCEVVAFIATRDAGRAQAFYEGQLGLSFESDNSFALVSKTGRSTLRVVRVEDFTPAPYTVLGWNVGAIETIVAQLRDKGVQFERYPWLEQDGSGIWTAPDGAKVAWFLDPDGNVLSVSQG